MRGVPDAVLVARDLKDIEEALQLCHTNRTPVTFCGSQTSMTGASVAQGGLLIATERLEKVLDIHASGTRATATTQPGITITELKKAVATQGWFYPPAPTSADDARIGATVSTNAGGEDSYQYGSTRKYIRELKVLLADGTKKVLSRKADEIFPDELNRAGYFPHAKNPIDLFIGGEGTLGFIYEVTVDLVQLPAGFFAALAPFPDSGKAIDFAIAVVTEGKLKARALELIDEGALEFMKKHATFPASLQEAKALIYFKQEFRDDAEMEKLLGGWLLAIERFAPADLAEKIVVATTDKQKENLRKWRHHIPSSINEEYRRYWPQGGGKVGSDWWVPIPKLREMMQFVYESGKKLGFPFMAYAHIGRGHPHVNYLCKTAEEKRRAEECLLQCCRKAVAFGGGLTGEHGVGKLHRNLVPIQWQQTQIKKMIAIKKEWDPNWILGRGNILTPTSS